MRMLNFARRSAKEILRDPLTVVFGVGFPIVLLLLLTAIQRNVPVSLFELETLTPGIVVFGLSFMTLFSALLVAKDRTTSLFSRLCTTPMRSVDFILGYLLPMLPVAVLQALICFLAALILGMAPTARILLCLVFLVPIALLYLSLGLLFGSLLNDKQVGGICGALLTNLSAWLSGTWFDISLVGGAFEAAAELLPFIHSVRLQRLILSGGSGVLTELLWVGGYAAVVTLLAVVVFRRKMK